MPRFLLWSDLHLEHQGFDLPDPKDFNVPIDGILLAGDTDSGLSAMYLRFAKRAWDRYGVPIVAVLGNHEFYGCEMSPIFSQEKKVLADMRLGGANITVLHGDQVIIAGTRIVGDTLWTDFQLRPEYFTLARQKAEGTMNDFRLIRRKDPFLRRLTTLDTIEIHQEQKARILQTLAQPHDGATIVMTHHMPIAEAVHAKYLSDPLNAAFASDLLGEIRELHFDVWAYGHSHDNNELEIDTSTGVKRFVSNPRGYPREQTRFDPLRIIEV